MLLMALIPKVEAIGRAKELRSISLCKILSTVLANRFRKVIGKLLAVLSKLLLVLEDQLWTTYW